MVHFRVAERYVEGDEEITEGTNTGPLQRYMLRLDAVEEGVSEVVVRREGSERGMFGAQVVVFPERFVFSTGEGP